MSGDDDINELHGLRVLLKRGATDEIDAERCRRYAAALSRALAWIDHHGSEYPYPLPWSRD